MRKIFGPQQKAAPKRQLDDIEPNKSHNSQRDVHKNLTKAQILRREADIRAANKAAWSQLR